MLPLLYYVTVIYLSVYIYTHVCEGETNLVSVGSQMHFGRHKYNLVVVSTIIQSRENYRNRYFFL